MLNDLNNFVYENHLGQRFVGLENGMYMNHSDILDYSWSYDVINSRISRFYHPVTTKSLPLVVIGKTEAEATAAKKRLLEIAEADIQAIHPGKIYVGEYYLSGFVTASKKSKYLFHKRYCNLNLKFTSADPTWYREKTYPMLPCKESTVTSGGGADYPYDYAYDYATSKNGKIIVCDSIHENAFRMRIYGEATDPTVIIGGHIYKISGTVAKGETLLIDSLSKKITLNTATGENINWFDNRSRDSYVFEPIPAGQNTVVWNGSFGFDLTVIEKRSEPRWT